MAYFKKDVRVKVKIQSENGIKTADEYDIEYIGELATVLEDDDCGWPYLKFDNEALNTDDTEEFGKCIYMSDEFLDQV